MIAAADVKIAVLQIALGIKSLEDSELLLKLEEFWYSAYFRGREDQEGGGGGWDAFYKLRKAVGEDRYPGMNGEIHAADTTGES